MEIAVLGTGMVGRTISLKLSELGYKVTMGTRNVEQTLAKTEGDTYGNASFSDWQKQHPDINLENFQNAVQASEGIVFNCTSGLHSKKVLESAGKKTLNDKIIIDVANPLDFSNGMPPTLNPVNEDSLGEQLQSTFPESHVVKTLNTMNANVMVNPSIIKGDHNVFICGNDSEAKENVKDILTSFGWDKQNIIDLGDITNARGTEMLLPIWLRLWNTLGTAHFNFHIQK